ncbi:MAG: 6-carboxytetrahydropterin synthase [Ignavibacteria bacterium]|jgi:6-pyruvoyltetrahydropterin/6-carboxytetrahydropterin synthase|nr:6-carboxytetrahydropterin synthase [Ignavibacteria bacterium]MDH7527918.1 6-carboxytetrahydropterin synthase [Ignavibacteria bacterium]
MKVSKEFHWEMAHRLPFHSGRCRNLHGHSYKALVQFEGELNQNGMLIDFYDIFSIVNPIIDEMDHSIICDINDKELIEIAQKINERIVIIDKPTTAENISIYIAEKILKSKLPENLVSVTVMVYETSDAFAEYSVRIK